jgi:hypothetical protein
MLVTNEICTGSSQLPNYSEVDYRGKVFAISFLGGVQTPFDDLRLPIPEHCTDSAL